MLGSTKLFPHLLFSLCLYGTFWLHDCDMYIEVIYAAVSIPENKGQSLVKTEDKMINNSKTITELNEDPEGCKKLLEPSS